jgi:hypothetical protein
MLAISATSSRRQSVTLKIWLRFSHRLEAHHERGGPSLATAAAASRAQGKHGAEYDITRQSDVGSPALSIAPRF